VRQRDNQPTPPPPPPQPLSFALAGVRSLTLGLLLCSCSMYMRARRGPAPGGSGGTIDLSYDTLKATYRAHRRLSSSNSTFVWGRCRLGQCSHNPGIDDVGWGDQESVLDVDALDNQTHSVSRNGSAPHQLIPPSDLYETLVIGTRRNCSWGPRNIYY
jgi:hypothetical protein